MWKVFQWGLAIVLGHTFTPYDAGQEGFEISAEFWNDDDLDDMVRFHEGALPGLRQEP